MKITKIGHCCLLVETKKVRILTDPGEFSEGQNTLEDINAVLITHEHGDHLHIESLKTILANNPNTKVYANEAVGKILDDEDISYKLLNEGGSYDIDGVSLQTWNCDHADVYTGITPVLNTALMIDNLLFYPGDALYNPGVPVEILALPVEGPWLKISEAIDYAKEIKPRLAFPVHDARLDPARGGTAHAHPKKFLAEVGIEFKSLWAGDSLEV